MSSWMTSGKARLNARQNRTFEKRAQQRAQVMAAGSNSNNSNFPHRILRERSDPNANYQADPHSAGTKRHRSGNIEIISGERAKAKYSPNNPIRRRGVVATARRIHHPHSLDEHHHWQSQSHSCLYPTPPPGEYPHLPPSSYHPDPHYDPRHHTHRYPPHHHHFSCGQDSRSHHSRQILPEGHSFPTQSKYPTAPLFHTGLQAMTYDYKTAQWIPLPPQQHHQYRPPPPSDPIKEAQVYPSAQEALLENYHHPHHDDPAHHSPNHQNPNRHCLSKPPFQDRQPPHYKYRDGGENEPNHHRHTKPPFQDKVPSHYKSWESSNHDGDDYLYYGDDQTAVNLEAAASFELPLEPDENVLNDPHPYSPPHLAFESSMKDVAAQATMGHYYHHHKPYTIQSNWAQNLQVPPELAHLPNDYDRHQNLLEEPAAAANVYPQVKYSKSEMEPWEVGDEDVDQTKLQMIERSKTWSPGSAVERQSFTINTSARGRRVSRYTPPRLPFSPPRLPEGLERFQKKRRTMSQARLIIDETKDETGEDEAEPLSQGPRLFNNGVQVNEDGTPLFGPAGT